MFRVRQYLKGSLWFFPLTGAVLGLLFATLVRHVDISVTLPRSWQYTSSTATVAATTQPETADQDLVLVVRSRRPGSIQAIDTRGLVAWASQHNCQLEARSAVGDFVATGQPVIEVFGSGPVPATTGRRLQRMIALGIERTLDQDPAFAVRVMVDVAIRALSAAINDPTTAVQVLDHLEDLLRLIGSTPLHGRLVFTDQSGTPGS